MALTVKIGDAAEEAKEEKPKYKPLPINLNIRKSVDGKLMVRYHPDVDIVILTDLKKVVIFPKEKLCDKVYDVQDRILKYLVNKGLVHPSSIQGGGVYGALEGAYPESDEPNTLNLILLALSQFIEEEKQYIEIADNYEKEWEEGLTDPDREDSTELGEVPQETQKGSIRPGYIYSPYGISSLYRYE